MVGNEQHVFEELSLYGSEQILYSAKIEKQNNGKTIKFAMSSDKDSCVIFENPTHDFPQRIKYCFIKNDEIHVNVSSNDGRNLEVNLKKVKEE